MRSTSRERKADQTLSSRAVGALAIVAAVSVANGYYIQPLLVDIGAAAGLSSGSVELLPALTQIGLAIGLIVLLPLADTHSTRRVLLGVIPFQIAALVLITVGDQGWQLMAGCLLIGVFGITPYLLPPYASQRVSAVKLGHVTGVLTRGVIAGILLARTVAGVTAVYLGWRSVYVIATVAMLAMLAVLMRLIKPQIPTSSISYGVLLKSLISLIRTKPALRTAALCQALSFGSFNVFWLGLSLYLQSPLFCWKPDAVGLVGILGAVAAMCAPLFGRVADRIGAPRTRVAALGTIVLAWIILAAFRNSLVGLAVGLIVLDVGATVVDVSNRTILYTLAPEIRTRLNAVYTVAMFVGGGVMTILLSIVWAWQGWLAVCLLGLVAVAVATSIATVALWKIPLDAN